MTAPDHQAGADVAYVLIPGVFFAAYVWAVYRQKQRGRSWRPGRMVWACLGTLALMVSLSPPLMEFAHEDFRGHMIQHLLLGMLAPLGIVFAAPVTLLLRITPLHAARRIVRFLRSAPIHFLSHPITALFLNVGGMYLLYLTPLYAESLRNPALHLLVHVHFFVAGCLFTWAIAGPDPGPHRPGFRFRLVILFLSMGTHAVLGKLMYGYGWPRGTHHDLGEIREAAQLMYYGGDLAEMILLVALLLVWRQKRERSRQGLASGPEGA